MTTNGSVATASVPRRRSRVRRVRRGRGKDDRGTTTAPDGGAPSGEHPAADAGAEAAPVVPEPNTGVEHVTRVASDMGRFTVPSLRNVAVTAPYMHDGSIATLDGVLDHYVAGGRTIESGPNAGVGSANPYKDPLIEPFSPSAQDRADVVEFSKSLTDETFLANPQLSDPW